jgi:hypothetical protein
VAGLQDIHVIHANILLRCSVVHPELYVGSFGTYGEGQRCLAVIGPMRGAFGEIGKLS